MQALCNSTLRPLTDGRYGGKVQPMAAQPKLKRADKVRQDIRDSARGEPCLMQLPGVCTHEAIWSHARWPWAGKGGATKSVDVAGAYVCSACDAVYDGQRKPPPGWSRAEVDAEWHVAHMKSMVRLTEKGIV